MKSNFRRMLIVLLLVSSVLIILGGDSRGVKSSSYETFTANASTGSEWLSKVQNYGVGDTFNDCRYDDTGVDESTSLIQAGVGYETDWHKWRISETFIRFDISGLPAGVDVVEMRIVAEPDAIIDTGDWGADHYYSFYSVDHDYIHPNPSLVDYGHTYQHIPNGYRVAGPIGQLSCTVGVDKTWPIKTPYWDYFLEGEGGDDVWVEFMTEYQALGWSPGEAVAASTLLKLISVRLEIDYVGVANPRSMTDDSDDSYHDNDAKDTTILGTETTDNITWNTIRLLYNDEYPQVLVNGDSGANVTLSLVGGAGQVLSTISDSIRVDNIYAWQITDVPVEYAGFIRVRDSISGEVSPWGYISSVPDSSQLTNRIYARFTEYPQYDREFSGYVVQRGDLLFHHWKTDVDGTTDNLSALSLGIWSRGDTAKEKYSETLADLGTEYYLGSQDFVGENIHWRYAIFTPEYVAGQVTYNNLVQLIDLPFDRVYKGFIQAVITDTDNVTDEYTETHSAYWYLSNAGEGIAITSKYSNYAVDDEIDIVVTIGGECNVETDLPSVKIEILYGDDIVQTHNFSIVEGVNEISMSGFSVEGSYTARCHFISDLKTYDYVKDIPFTVSGDTSGVSDDDEAGVPGVGDWKRALDELIARWGLDNEPGHWLIIIVLSLIVAILFRGMPVVATGLVILIMSGALIFEWLNPWFIVLLTLGAGAFIYAWVKRSRKVGV